VIQVNRCIKSDDILLNDEQPPTCEITGPIATCPRTTNTYAAPAGMNDYGWSISGNGLISGPANQATVQIVAGSACGQSYTLALTTRSNICTTSCSAETLVVDTTPPVLTCPADLVLNYPANTGTNATGVAIATDSCSLV